MKDLKLARRSMVAGGVALGSTSLLSAKASGTEPTSITWLSLRPEHRSRRDHSFTNTSGKLEVWLPSPLIGIACIAFAIGAKGAAWLEELAASQWFSGLEPQPDDIAEGGLAVKGQLLLEDEDVLDPAGISAMLERVDWPTAPVAAIAVPQGAQSSDQTATLCLVSELRARRNGHGCRIAVVVTLETTPGDDAFEQELLKRGALVARSGPGTSGHHLHHFPFRASTYPRNGRLVCVDLADYLTCWKPGSSAELHVLPLGADYGHSAVNLLPQSNDVMVAVNIDMHCDPAASGNELIELDRFASHCLEYFSCNEDCNYLFTTSDRLHGETGTVDIVVITRGRSWANPCATMNDHGLKA